MITRTTITVWCTTQFVAFHYWKNAPSGYLHLRMPHRHVFHVKVEVLVQHDDRHVEFQELKSILNAFIGKTWGHATSFGEAVPDSCEMMADKIVQWLGSEPGRVFAVRSVTVSEDGENGATCEYDRYQ